MVERDVDFVSGDIRDAGAVDAMRGIDEVHHLAFVNGTATFFSAPDLVLDVGVKGIVNVIDACRRHGVGRLSSLRARRSTSRPRMVPTDERAPLVVPDPLNPRLSYGAGKIISEMMVINHGRKHFERVLIFRPHNVYGPDMGFDHVIPQFAVRLKRATAAQAQRPGAVSDPGRRRGDAQLLPRRRSRGGRDVMREKGAHLGIYHVGTAGRGQHRRSRPPHGGHRRPRDRASSFGGTRRQHAAPLPGYFEARRARLAALASRSTRACRRRSWYWDHESMAPAV